MPTKDKTQWQVVSCSVCREECRHDPLDHFTIYEFVNRRTNHGAVGSWPAPCDDGAGDIPGGFVCSAACRSQAMFDAATLEQQEALDTLMRAHELAAGALVILGVRGLAAEDYERDSASSFFRAWFPDLCSYFGDTLDALAQSDSLLRPPDSHEPRWVTSATENI